MTLDPDGYPFIALAAAPSLLARRCRRTRLALGLAVLPVAMAAFFRDPDRRPDAAGEDFDPDQVIAPADGRVMHVGEPLPGTAPAGEWQQVSIFLSVTDVHINRTPYGGEVTEVTHRPGRFLAAYKAESAHENERSEITVVRLVDHDVRTVVFRQIGGVLARRVVTRVRPGQAVRTGERIGLMKFGSRMDVFVPPEVELVVERRQRVVAGETVLGRWPAGGPS
ncbi:MAG: phosphatidylserine decarboxylase [Actinobacteria bacterium]|nr:phosphatidylserine decarboxylase [Actinomycetota bacterium]